MASSKYTCEARILDQLKATPVLHSTTKECGAETNKRISVDSGEAYMSICSCCLKRFIRRSVDKSWFGWFDCDYPPEAQVVGSKWYYENVATKVSAVATPVVVQGPPIVVQAESVQAVTELSTADKKNKLRERIKEIQKIAKPGIMNMKEIQVAFKQITDLKAQIHML